MNAFFFDVLVQAHCVYAPDDKSSNLYFNLTFKEKTDFSGTPSKYLPEYLSEEVLFKIASLSSDDDRNIILYEIKRAIKENKMTIRRPRSSNFNRFQSDMLNTLEKLEKIFKEYLTECGSVMYLSFSHGFSI